MMKLRITALCVLTLLVASCSETMEATPSHSIIPGVGSTFSYRSRILSIDTVYTYRVIETGLEYEGRTDVSRTDGMGYIEYSNNGDFVRYWNGDIWQIYPMGTQREVMFLTRTKDFGSFLQTEDMRVVPGGDVEMPINGNLLTGQRFNTIRHIRTYKRDYTPIDDRYDTARTIWSYDLGMPLYDEVGTGPMTMELVSYELK